MQSTSWETLDWKKHSWNQDCQDTMKETAYSPGFYTILEGKDWMKTRCLITLLSCWIKPTLKSILPPNLPTSWVSQFPLVVELEWDEFSFSDSPNRFNPMENAGTWLPTKVGALYLMGFSGSGRSPGEGNGNPFQYSCLENPMDRGAVEWECRCDQWKVPSTQ